MGAAGRSRTLAYGHLGLVHRRGAEPPEVSRFPRLASKAVYADGLGRLRQHRRPGRSARHQDRRAEALPRSVAGSNPRWPVSRRNGAREDEVHPVGRRLRPAAPRPAGLGDLRARKIIMADQFCAGGAEDQGHQAVPGRPEEVHQLHHRCPTSDVHGLHHLRHGHRGRLETRATRPPHCGTAPNLRKLGGALTTRRACSTAPNRTA